MLLCHTHAKDSVTLTNTFLIPLARFHPSMMLLCGAILGLLWNLSFTLRTIQMPNQRANSAVAKGAPLTEDLR